MLAVGLVAAVAPAASATTHSSKAKDGFIRLAHFSPNTPAVDVYLYSFGDPKAMIVLHHVAYGAVSPYEKVKVGQYTVAMRGAGAKPSSQPVLSTNVQITPDGAYTVAGVGPAKGIKLQVIRDRLSTPPGKAEVRVIQASLRHPRVTVRAAGHVLVHNLAFAHMTSYMAVKPGDWMVSVRGGGKHAGKTVALTAGTLHTVVVLDGSHGALQLTDLVDAAGSAVMPAGGAGTGFGGTAPAPAPSPLPWIAVVAGGVLCFGAGAYGLRRRTAPRHAAR
ncbi:MAG TPA: DUF4397 domain-containing protein [Streptosporangiaceae bacterium]|jgi:hypothetical protein